VHLDGIAVALPIARRMGDAIGSLCVPSPSAMNAPLNGCPSTVPRTLTSPRVPKTVAESGSFTQAQVTGRPRGAEGAELLDVARAAFLEVGFASATMSDIATGARISKSSLYRDYPSKDSLFAAVVADWVERGRDAMRPHIQALLDADSLEPALRQFAATLQAGILSDAVLGMRRIVAADAERFPDVARSYVAESWGRNIDLFAKAFAELMRRGSLVESDSVAAARLFTWMVVGDPLNARTLGVGSNEIAPAALDAIAADAVATFGARYFR
jgi:TetR/AcrR family transcriptional regulator, mexJK operon transcriptional repressor